MVDLEARRPGPPRRARDRLADRVGLQVGERHPARCGAGALTAGAGAEARGDRRAPAERRWPDRPIHWPLPHRQDAHLRVLRPSVELLDRRIIDGAEPARASARGARALALRLQVPAGRRPGGVAAAAGEGQRDERGLPAQVGSEGRAREPAARHLAAGLAAGRDGERPEGGGRDRRTDLAGDVPSPLRASPRRRRDPRARHRRADPDPVTRW